MEGFDPHILDVTEMVFVRWYMINEETIAWFWIKSRAMLCLMEAELKSRSGFSLQNTVSEDTNLILDSLARLSLNPDRRDAFFREHQNMIYEKVFQAFHFVQI